MTAPGEAAFETLIYTDCVPGQGLQGTGGLQFQARSSGADRAAQQVVLKSLLYEPPDPWMRQRRPVEDYPPSFAHVHDGIYATAAGVYLGKEANGGREGNQLTHSIVTTDPAVYGLVRPAQLFGAPFWTRNPASTTVSEPIPAEWYPGPFDAAEAQKLVVSDPKGRDRLTALVTALDAIGGEDERRILFIAEDAETVLRWTVAATLLVPQRKALTIGIKVFTLKPAYATQPIIAVHPDWGSTNATVANDSGYVVVDLVGGDFTRIGTVPARRRVDMFCERDPFDVVDLIEYADHIDLDPEARLDLATAMTWEDWPAPMTPELARLAVRWLRDSAADVLPDRRDVLAERLCARIEQWDWDVLVDLDAVAVSGQLPAARVPDVRLALIRAGVARTVRDPRAKPQTLAPLPADVWLPVHDEEAEEIVRAALLDCGRNSVFDALLRLAKSIGVAVDVPRLGRIVDQFVADWAAHPEHPYPWPDWQSGRELRGLLLRELTRQVDAGDGDGVGDRWWKRMQVKTYDLLRPLDRAVIAASMLHSGPDDRRALMREVLGSGAAVDTVHVMFSRTAPTNSELNALVELMPDDTPLPLHIFERLRGEVIDRQRPLSVELLKLVGRLTASGLYRAPLSVQAVLDDDERLDRIIRMLPEMTVEQAKEHSFTLDRMDRRLRDLRAETMNDALLRVADPLVVCEMVRGLSDRGYTLLLDEIIDLMRSKSPENVLLTAFVLSRSRVLDTTNKERLRRPVLDAISRTSERRQKSLAKQLDAIGGGLPGHWRATVEESRKPSLLSRLRGAGKTEKG